MAAEAHDPRGISAHGTCHCTEWRVQPPCLREYRTAAQQIANSELNEDRILSYGLFFRPNETGRSLNFPGIVL